MVLVDLTKVKENYNYDGKYDQYVRSTQFNHYMTCEIYNYRGGTLCPSISGSSYLSITAEKNDSLNFDFSFLLSCNT